MKQVDYRLILEFFFMHVIYVGNNFASCNSVQSDTGKLRGELLNNYERTNSPFTNSSTATAINIIFDAQHIIKMDDKYGNLMLKGVLMMKWLDERLAWDKKRYKNTKVMKFSGEQIWLPHISVVYSSRAEDLVNKNLPVLVHRTGIVEWYPIVVVDVPCEIDSSHYPFEKGSCMFQLESWSDSGDMIALETLDFPLESFEKEAVGDWKLNNVTCVTNHQNFRGYGEYSTVVVYVSIRRTSSSFWYTFLVIEVISAILTVSGFFLSASDIRRYVIGCLNVFVTFCTLLQLQSTVPRTEELPIIVKVCATFLFLSVIFLLETSSISLMQNLSTTKPECLLRLTRYIPEKPCCFEKVQKTSPYDRYVDTGPDDTNRITSFNEKLERSTDWLKLATVIDRLALLAFIIAYLTLFGMASSK